MKTLKHQNFNLTQLGRDMAELPMDPIYSSLLFESVKRNLGIINNY